MSEEGSAWAADASKVQPFPGQTRVGEPTLKGEPLWECAKSALLGLELVHESFVILDWDDTILPSTALAANGYFGQFPNVKLKRNAEGSLGWEDDLPEEDLALIAAAALSVLRAAQKFGTRLIVTNANHGWVQEAAAKFLPSLVAELRDIPVISARSIFEPQGIDPRQWKTLCFQRIVKCFHSGPAGIFGVRNLISIGDSTDEQEATMKVAQSCPCYVKSIKLMERPTMSHLAQQLQLCSSHLAHISSYAGNVDIDIGVMVAIEGESILKELNVAPPKLSTFSKKQGKDAEPLEKRRRLLPWASQLGA